MIEAMRKYKVYTIAFFIVFFSLLFSTNLSFVYGSDETFEEKRVLFISSYSSAFPTFQKQIDGLHDYFYDYPIILDIEFMDTKRFFNDTNLQNFEESITYKLSQVEYDLLITSDDNAINFAIEHKDTLFEGLPIIFFGVNNTDNAETYAALDNVTGVIEDVSWEETIDLAITLNSSATEVIGLVDNTPSGQSDKTRFEEVSELYPDLQFATLDMSNYTMNEYLTELRKIDNSSIIILFSALRDKNDVSFNFYESTELLLRNTNQPIYHVFEHGVEEGLIGGMVVSHYEQATTAASMAIDYFEGTSISSIELISESPNVYLINYEVFNEYGYYRSYLPSDTQFVNRELSFFQENSLYILGIIGFISFQSLVIGLLYRAVKDNKSSQMALQKANDQLSYNATHDYLTGLYNRNFFEIKFPELDNITDETVSIVLIDVNGLKLINDAFGHVEGDKALTETASLLLETFLHSDVFRIGGDEFAIFLYNKTETEVSILINTLNRKVSKVFIQGVPLSVSIGYALLDGTKTINEAFTEAEDWMYREKLNQVPSNRSAIIDTIIATINQKDVYSEAHSKRVSVISAKIAELAELGDNIISEVKTAGLLHDIGKIIIPSSILNKTGKLTNEEFDEIKKHSEIGYRILNSVSSMRDISEHVFAHHERPDGTGYPRGLKDSEISVQAKIIALADAIDAMLTDRLYRGRLSKEACYKELSKNKGAQFDNYLTDVVLNNFDELVDLLEEQY